MLSIHSCELPSDALLNRYLVSGAFVDCYVTEVTGSVSHAEFVEAFYTTTVFRLERWILRIFVSRPSTNAEARQLARGELSTFAAWTVEERASDQLLLSDFTGRTRSWFKVAPSSDTSTRLYFGSAVVPVRERKTGGMSLGPIFTLLLGFHKMYSRILLLAARWRLSGKLVDNPHRYRGDA